jgi:hypothetical protein
MLGHGEVVNRHSGNMQYCALVKLTKVAYLSPATRKLKKVHIAQDGGNTKDDIP